MVGYTTHRSGHVMAPMDIVFEVEEEPKPQRIWLKRIAAYTMAIGAAELAYRVLWAAVGGSPVESPIPVWLSLTLFFLGFAGIAFLTKNESWSS